jgi:hypothetical protein
VSTIADRLAQAGPQRIRILCPSRDFVADAWLAPDGHGGIGMQLHGPHKRSIFDRRAGWYGYLMSIAQHRAQRHPLGPDVSVTLRCTRCRYTAQRHYLSLAVELAEAALAGQREYLLAT